MFLEYHFWNTKIYFFNESVLDFCRVFLGPKLRCGSVVNMALFTLSYLPMLQVR